MHARRLVILKRVFESFDLARFLVRLPKVDGQELWRVAVQGKAWAEEGRHRMF